ncbi:MAG: transcriptional regulator [bacterium]|nr:transcriptional regulator [bacterium]
MNCKELLEIIDQGEDYTHQFKEDFSSIHKLAVEISAFANSEGGMIFIGVTDSGELKGLSKEDVGRLNQWISNSTSDNIDKQIFVKTEVLICREKRILIIDVPRGLNKPYAVNRVDVWVKSGADKRRAPLEEVLRLAQTSGLFYADELETEAAIEKFDNDFFLKHYQQYYKEEIEKLEIPLEKLLTNIRLIKEGRLTLAGLLLFGKNPGRIRPQFSIKATVFDGNEISMYQFKDKEDITGKLIDQYNKAKFFIKRNLRLIQKNRNFNAPGILEIPEDAFAEVIANAIVHRNYYINAQVQIYLFDDRLEIVSPGTLPNTITEENIKFGVHIERNPTILSFLEKDPAFSYSGRGSGIPTVLKMCKQADVGIELLDDKQKQQFKVTFSRTSR